MSWMMNKIVLPMFDIDIPQLARLLLPPVLRSKFLTELLKVLLTPLTMFKDRFKADKTAFDKRLNISGLVLQMETAMNQECFTNDIRIVSDEPDEAPTLYFESEKMDAVYLYKQGSGDDPLTLLFESEYEYKPNFIVYVPRSRCTSLDTQEADAFGWMYLTKIVNILNTYKPAGRTYRIELYES